MAKRVFTEEQKKARAENQRDWRKRNKGYQKDWIEKNKEARSEYLKAWRETNKESLSEYARTWRENNKSYHNVWARENAEHLSAYCKQTTANLGDGYLSKLLKQKFDQEDITPELIELKRITLKMHRQAKSITI